MLLWINGPFGGGKTQTAYELRRRLPGSVVCDPEHIGFGLHRTLPPGLREDFRDLAAWRAGVLETLDLALTRHDGHVVVPMTLTDPAHHAEILGELRERGHDVRHFTLLASRETVLRRLRERGLGHVLRFVVGKEGVLKRESWAVGQLDHCLERLREPEFAEHLWTDESTVAKTADRVAVLSGLTLTPNKDGALRGRARRALVGIRHIRLD
ncbi:AAA family ATPase [Streptomyces xanthii]|uniref:AAA family ATPase n=1 Tax=Streptomyces xanthii TaxID=2768069 RepID=A0A7H1BA39_9ACTN|nr:AAA family ATPase [Streptomyces xanthii]QNS05594.1 AAA family ATPase [Streptomyces xanthii]